MRLTTWWTMWMSFVSLCGLVPMLHSLGAEEPSPERWTVDTLCQAMPSRCTPGDAQLPPDALWVLDGLPFPPAEDLWALEDLTLPPGASAPPADPLASQCQYVGFQTEWLASKRDAGLPLGEVLAASRRVFMPDLPWHDAIIGAMAILVYHAPQRSPAELHQAMETACLVRPLLWTEPSADW